jgi:hypothetical protein
MLIVNAPVGASARVARLTISEPNSSGVDAEGDENLDGSFAFGEQSEKEMLGADVDVRQDEHLA